VSYRTRSGQLVSVGPLLAKGGEGEVYAVSSPPGMVFKKYLPVAFSRDPALDDRLRAMVAHPPAQWREPQSQHVSLAWPTDMVLENGRFAGFLMAAVEMAETVELHRVTNPDDRRRATGSTGWARGFSWRYLVHAAVNLAQATQMLHEAGVVIGDFNERNSRVTRDARVTLLDCDSMQISDPATGGWFFCRVGRPEYTPPELIHADWSKTVRHASSDLFALAIHIYQFLLEGEHPFRGKWTGPGEKPSVTDLAAQGTWAQQNGGLLQPRPSAISAAMLPDVIMNMFRTAFEDGAVNPGARPTARAWHQALTDLESSLRPCQANPEHYYPRSLPACPWCRREAARAATQRPLPPLITPAPATTAATRTLLAPTPPPAVSYSTLIPAPRTGPNVPVPVPVTPVTVTSGHGSGSAQRAVRATLIGGAIVLVAVIAIVVGLSSAGSNSGSPGTVSAGSSTSVPGNSGSDSDQATAMNSLLQQSSASRNSVESNVAEVQDCSDVTDGASGLEQDISDRQTELDQAKNLSVSALPEGATLKSDLVGAIQNSLEADDDFLSWAQGVGSCASSAPEDGNYQAGMTASTTAVSYKDKFCGLWNPIAQDQGFSTLTQADI